MGNVVVHHGNAAELGGFGHFHIRGELAKPTTLPGGEKVYQTNDGRAFTTRKMSP